MARTLVLLHGFTHTGASWQPVIATLGERYLVVAPDIRGHGTAGATEPVTLEAVLADVSAAAPDRFVLAGYSMGGRIALHVALALADRVQRLVLIGASPGIADAAERGGRRAGDDRMADQIERSSIDEFARRWAAMPVLAGLAPSAAADVHLDRLRSTPAGLARALRGLGNGVLPSAWDRLGELRMPVTLVVGERDQKFAVLAERMAAAIPDAELVIVPAVGHAAHLEAPEQLAAVIAGSWPGRDRHA